MAKPPGSTAPGSATTTSWPASTLGAPQTIPRGFSSPTSTWHQVTGFLNLVSRSISSTRPTTSGPSTVDRRSTISSTSMPMRTSACSSAAGCTGTSTYSRSQETPIRTRLTFHSESPGEAHIALHHVVHVADPVAEHQGALDTHPERETRVDIRVDAAGPQHARVDHPAAAPLDPSRSVAVRLEP